MTTRGTPPGEPTPPDPGQSTMRFPVEGQGGAPTPDPTPPPWATPPGGTPAVPAPAVPTVVTPVTPPAGTPIGAAAPTAAYPLPPAASTSVYSGPPEAVPPPPPVPPANTAAGVPPSGRSPLPWILGGVAALALLSLLLFLLTNNRAAVTPTPTPGATATDTPTPLPTATPLVVVVTNTVILPTNTVAPTNTPGVATVTPTATATETPVPGLPTVTPPPTATPAPPTPTVVPATNTAVPATASPAPSTATEVPPGGATVIPGDTPVPQLTVGTPEPGTPGAQGTLPPAVGTAGPADAAPAVSRQGLLTLQWFGQSSFLIAGGEGVRILIDPAPPTVGYHLPFFTPLDAVLITHLHPDHTFTQVVPGGVPNYVGLSNDGHFRRIRENVKTAAVRDVASFHDSANGSDRGENAMWVIDIDGFHIVHLGDLGQLELTDQQRADIGHPDILMVPVGGGGFTITGMQARAIVNDLQPSIVIPMHYRTDRTPASLPLEPVDNFLGQAPPANAPNVARLKRSDLRAKRTLALVMNYH